MSLTSFLGKKDVKERFRQEFEKPKFGVKRELLALPISKQYVLVGTAFDYLMRFYLKRLNPNAVTRQWVAEYSLAHLIQRFSPDVVYGNGGIVSYTETELTKKAQWIIKQAETGYLEYLSSGQLTDQLIESAVCLAQLDFFYRSSMPIDPNLGTVDKEAVDDLRNLISIVEPELFTAAHLCLLNPSFGKGSKLVKGADADLLIDNTLIDIKTTQKCELMRKDFNQLIGYFVLHEISGIGDGLTPRPKISKVAIYFSRHAYLHTFELQDIAHTETLRDFVKWFIERAKQEFDTS